MTRLSSRKVDKMNLFYFHVFMDVVNKIQSRRGIRFWTNMRGLENYNRYQWLHLIFDCQNLDLNLDAPVGVIMLVKKIILFFTLVIRYDLCHSA